MGNASSSHNRQHQEDSVDFGSLTPQGVYTGPRDWNHGIVSQLIVSRKLAPFYRPLEDYDPSWDDEQILAARKVPPDNADSADHPVPRPSSGPHSLTSKGSISKRSSPQKETINPEAAIYRGAVECPICFLYYPPNINHSRCCDQAICTECFVQIKRSEPTTTHLVSEPAACPYCVQENFGIVYTPPPWRAGIGSEGTNASWSELIKDTKDSSSVKTLSTTGTAGTTTPSQPPTHKRRQKSYGADSPEVVTTDQIRPDWEAKLAAVRAAVARRANRRIVLQQIGGRLVPVGITSGRVHALSPEEAEAAASENSSGRRRRRQHGQGFGPNSGMEQYIGIPGQDLEELMLMEAMRLSLLEHEEYQRKQKEEERKKREAEGANTTRDGESGSAAAGEAGSSAASGGQPLGSATSTTTSSSTPVFSSASQTPPGSTSRQSQTQSLESQIETSPESNGRTDRNSSRGKSWSISRSQNRTPPPISAPGLSLQDSGSPLSHASPPPFSTLNAALSSASTALAILGNENTNGEGEGNKQQQRGSGKGKAKDVEQAVPTDSQITRTQLESTSTDSPSPSSFLTADTGPSVEVPAMKASERVLGGYGQLLSSPESDATNEPLLSGNWGERNLHQQKGAESEWGSKMSSTSGL